MKKTYTVKTKVWLYPGDTWHFVTIPQDITKEINFFFGDVKRGWGSLPVVVTVGKTDWKTSIFPDKKTETFILPIKSEVRKKEEIHADDKIDISIELER